MSFLKNQEYTLNLKVSRNNVLIVVLVLIILGSWIYFLGFAPASQTGNERQVQEQVTQVNQYKYLRDEDVEPRIPYEMKSFIVTNCAKKDYLNPSPDWSIPVDVAQIEDMIVLCQEADGRVTGLRVELQTAE